MNSPLVSVIIPTFNRLSMLKETVQCVFDQTYENWELIILDDGSTDSTRSWLSKLIKTNNKIKVFFNESNLGMIDNWNKGVLLSSGKYLSILMDDDLWEKEFLNKTINILENYSDIGLVSTNIVPFSQRDREGNLITHQDNRYRVYKSSTKKKGFECIIQAVKSKWMVGLPSAVLVRKQCFDELGLFDEVCLDREMWLRICSKYNYYFIDEELCFWREQLNGSYSSSKKSPFASPFINFRLLDKIYSYWYSHDNYFTLMKFKNRAYRRIRLQILSQLSLVESSHELSKLKVLYNSHSTTVDRVTDQFHLFLNFLKSTFFKFLNNWKNSSNSNISESFKQFIKIVELVKWINNGKPFPPPHFVKQKAIKKYKNKYNPSIFVETGTYMGEMVEAMKSHFEQIHSIELQNEFYKLNKIKFQHDNHIKIWNGDSAQVLKKLTPILNGSVLFWLDAHYSGGDTALSNKQTPIEKELEIILTTKNIKPIILIDDARFFTGENDYPTLKNLKKLLLKYKPQTQIEIKDDIIRIISVN